MVICIIIILLDWISYFRDHLIESKNRYYTSVKYKVFFFILPLLRCNVLYQWDDFALCFLMKTKFDPNVLIGAIINNLDMTNVLQLTSSWIKWWFGAHGDFSHTLYFHFVFLTILTIYFLYLIYKSK